MHAGAFVGSQARTLPVPDTLPNSTMRLYGGAQFHRAMSEFRSVTIRSCSDWCSHSLQDHGRWSLISHSNTGCAFPPQAGRGRTALP